MTDSTLFILIYVVTLLTNIYLFYLVSKRQCSVEPVSFLIVFLCFVGTFILAIIELAEIINELAENLNKKQ